MEEAAVEAARTMGQGDRKGSDLAAVQAMRQAFEKVPIAGTIVIGEGERDEAPMLYIVEKVGGQQQEGLRYAASGMPALVARRDGARWNFSRGQRMRRWRMLDF